MFGETAAVEVRLVTGDCAETPAMWLLRDLESGCLRSWWKLYLIVTTLELLSQILADLSC